MNKPAFTPAHRATIPTPNTATMELHNSIVSSFVSHFAEILTPALMIAHRKGCYATVINATYAGIPLEQTLGTDNAKLATEQVLNDIQARYSTVPDMLSEYQYDQQIDAVNELNRPKTRTRKPKA
jgi:hypothetical protein